MNYNIDFLDDNEKEVLVQGWAFDNVGRKVSLKVNAKYTLKEIHRYDVQAVFPDIHVESLCGFEIKIKKPIWNKNKRLFISFFNGMEDVLIPLKDDKKEIQEEHLAVEILYKPKISIVVPVYNTPKIFFEALISSVVKQDYENWELCLADGGSSKDFQEYLKTFISDKIKVIFLNENLGIAGNTNEAIHMATGEYIAFCDHDDILTENALYELAVALNINKELDFMYSDEDKLGEDNRFFQPNHKSDFNIKLLEVGNYINHLSVIKKDFLYEIGLLNADYDGSQDYDLLLRVAENTNKIYHIKKILYHWRCHSNSVAENPESKSYAFDNAIKALQAHFDRIDEEVEITKSEVVGSYKIMRK